MRRALLALLAALACHVVAAFAKADGVIVRSSLQPEHGAVVGQHIRVLVDVLFPSQMPRPPRVTIPEVAGGQLLRIETQATTISDRIDGQPYVGQRFEFALYPRRGGTVVVPPALVTLLDTAGDEAGQMRGQALETAISVPAGVDVSGPVIATTRATLGEAWAPQPGATLKAGDALVRTITREADDIPAMAMRDLAFVAPPGVRVYVDPPQSEDRQNRGDLVGRRVDRVTYVFGQAGTFEIAGVEQPWWDLEGKRLRMAARPSVSIVVTAADPPAGHGRHILWFVPVAVLALGLLAWWSWPRLRDVWSRRHARWLASEAKAFRDMVGAARTGKAGKTYQAFTVWRWRIANRAPLTSLAEELETVLFASPSPRTWSIREGRAFAARAASIRKALRPARSASHGALPALNPNQR